ncbi:hypothetical protein C8R45DRAFT_1220536 [Mycena sanguinolenta]|nr:hypothetical protein C8R45DRAFT_1220536 [Mycena sanguinolenta]
MPPVYTSDALDDEQFAVFLASLNLDGGDQAPSSTAPPSTPVRPSAPFERLTFPLPRFRARYVGALNTPTAATVPTPERLYAYESPTRRGQTPHWSEAGAATQGIPHASVRAVSGPKKRKKGGKSHAYVVFVGIQCGVFLFWAEVEPLVSRVPNSIFRGYRTLREASAAYAYAQERGWTRLSQTSAAPIPALPQPLDSGSTDTSINPLHGNETLDDRWFIVYRGITPGVYRSHLECQLNTLGLPNALHESIVGKPQALAKYADAVTRHEVSVILPSYTHRAQ